MMKRSAVVGLLLCMVLCIVSTVMAAQDGGYDLTPELWTKAVLRTPGKDVSLVWSEVGSDTTPSGAKVVSGYFYADPNDFAYGSQYNPELFVKIYIDPSGWCNMAFNHVTVDDIVVTSAHNYRGSPDQTGTATLTERLVEHQYTSVSAGTNDPAYDATGIWSIVLKNHTDSLTGNTQCSFDETESEVITLTQSGSSFYFLGQDGNYFSGTVDGKTYNFTGTWIEEEGYRITVTGSFNFHSTTSLTGSGHVSNENDGQFFCGWDQSYSGVKQ